MIKPLTYFYSFPDNAVQMAVNCTKLQSCMISSTYSRVLVNRRHTNFWKATEKLGEQFHCLKGKELHATAMEVATACTYWSGGNPEVEIDGCLRTKQVCCRKSA